jgi:single-stranded DNA-binding protein
MKYTLNNCTIGGSVSFPEFRTTKDGKTFFTCQLTTKYFNSRTKDNEYMNHSVVCYLEYEVNSLQKQNLVKGDKIIAIGELIPNNYTTKDGAQVQSYQILAKEFVILHQNAKSEKNQLEGSETHSENSEDDSIPF